MSSLGIMTLTRTPCELDKMSLFQDLKLKRRKVDSRCSSDGESVADTSTSSPDLVCPPSPKMEPVIGAGPTPSPDSRHNHLGSEGVATEATHPSVFDGGGATTSVIRQLPMRSQSPPPARPDPCASPCVPPRPHSSPGRPVIVAPPTTPPSLARHSPQPPPPPPHPQHCRVIEQQHPQQQQQQQQQQQTRSVISSVPTSLVQSQLWLQSSRINGVKPELIGGNLGATPLLDVKTNQGRALRQTPTVIMGEAGGVRTMIWSQPPLTLGSPPQMEASSPGHHHHPHPQQPPPTSWCSSSSSSTATTASGTSTVTTEESAAQMLLTLGQQRASPASTVAPPKPLLPPPFSTSPLNMERLWAGDLTQLPANQQMQALNLSSPPALALQPPLYASPNSKVEACAADAVDEEDTPMICMICEDKATGLHYGIITCEGCKGFFKRTVQNRRVYTCVADGNCEITKAQRNRCQYCRFKKCIEQGMVLQAVREDRMPGGRNSGAVYNLYKVKYKKHKKASTAASAAKQHQLLNAQQKMEKGAMLSPVIKAETTANSPGGGVPTHLVNGTILKTALTNPSEVVHLRQRLDSAVSSSRDRSFSIEYTLSMIQTLIDCDEFQDIATLRNLDDLLDHKSDLSEKLCQIGDSIVYKLVQWTKRLPFYLELPVEVHTRLLTHKWHELLVLTTSAYQAIHGVPHKETLLTASEHTIPGGHADSDFNQEVNNNLCTLQTCLTSMMGRPITMDQLRQDVGLMVEKITHVTLMFRRIKLNMEEYVCLKVITMLNQVRSGVNLSGSELESIQERYMTCLRAYTQHVYPEQPTRFQELLVRLPEVQSAAALLLESKMFYVPFLLNSAIQR